LKAPRIGAPVFLSHKVTAILVQLDKASLQSEPCWRNADVSAQRRSFYKHPFRCKKHSWSSDIQVDFGRIYQSFNQWFEIQSKFFSFRQSWL